MPTKRNLILSIIGLLAFSLSAFGQAITGSIQGTVSDEKGGAIVGAQVVLTSPRTGTTRTATSDSQGRYTFPIVEPGVYGIEVTQQGFAMTKVNGIELSVNKVGVVDVTLKINEVQAAVSVNDNVAILDTQSATLSGVVDTRRLNTLPLNGR